MVAAVAHILLIYDIADDRVRSRIADTCLDYGLARIQYSAFAGALSHTHQEELLLQLHRHLGRKPGHVQCFRLCATDWAGRQTLGRPLVAGSPFPSLDPTKGDPHD